MQRSRKRPLHFFLFSRKQACGLPQNTVHQSDFCARGDTAGVGENQEDAAANALEALEAALARRLGIHLPQVDRLLNLRHASRIEQVEAALKTLGRR